jgi:hypothetical protein
VDSDRRRRGEKRKKEEKKTRTTKMQMINKQMNFQTSKEKQTNVKCVKI